MRKLVASSARSGVISVSRSRSTRDSPIRAAVVADVNESVKDVDAVLLPGFPLIHRDHRWLAEHLVSGLRDSSLVGLYVEQPYRHQKTRYRRIRVDPSLNMHDVPRLAWHRLGMRPAGAAGQASCDLRLRSQLRWLELDGRKSRPHARARGTRGGERVAWLAREQVRHASRIAFGRACASSRHWSSATRRTSSRGRSRTT